MKYLLVAAVLAACSSGAKSTAPVAAETPPRTNDPGAVKDTPPLQPSTPQPEWGAHQHGSGAPKADGASCLAAAECSSGVCEGEGCGPSKPGRCAPKSRSCTRDLQPYCSCEGETFRTSGNCPGRRYAARAECTKP